MPRPFPSSAVFVMRLGLRSVATVIANKDPCSAFFDLNSKKNSFFLVADGAHLSFHNSPQPNDLKEAIAAKDGGVHAAAKIELGF